MGKKTIGILGGLGAEASAKFYADLISKFQKRFSPKTNTDYPHIILNSISAPDIIQKGGGCAIEQYISGLKELERSGADILAIVCNTAYCYLDALQRAVDAPIINIRQEVKDYLDENQVSSVMVLGSPASLECGLYSFDGIETLYPDEEEAAKLGESIADFNIGADKEKQTAFVLEMVDRYSPKANKILVGCSEIGVMVGGKRDNLIDTMDILSDAVLREIAND